uniref:Uncharacterized protein n=1 Tax=Anguilla anguilla TaxID=7936 RepID=A0A0E9QRQ5_ANGAN
MAYYFNRWEFTTVFSIESTKVEFHSYPLAVWSRHRGSSHSLYHGP